MGQVGLQCGMVDFREVLGTRSTQLVGFSGWYRDNKRGGYACSLFSGHWVGKSWNNTEKSSMIRLPRYHGLKDWNW